MIVIAIKTRDGIPQMGYETEMQRTPSAERLLHGIYAAADRPDLWQSTIDAIAGEHGGQYSAMFYVDLPIKNAAFDALAVSAFPATSVAAYTAHYGAQDTRLLASRTLAAGAIYLDDETMAFADVSQTEAYRDFYRPLGLGHCLAGALFQDSARAGFLTMHRAIDAGAFPTEAVASFTLLLPHVIRALQLQRQLGRARAVAGALTWALDHFPMAVLLSEPDGTLIEANRAGLELLSGAGSLLRLRLGRVEASVSGSADALRATLAGAANAIGGGPPPPILRLARPALPPLVIMAVARSTGSGAMVLLFISDPTARIATDRQSLAAEFGLTAAEADVLARLAEGQELVAVADQRQTSPETVRTQIRSLLAKTGAHRQSELMRLVSRSLASLRRRP